MHHYIGLSYVCVPRPRFLTLGIICSSEVSVSRQRVLGKVDEELSKGDEKTALTLVKDLQGKPGGLRCFGAVRQVFFFFLFAAFSFSS